MIDVMRTKKNSKIMLIENRYDDSSLITPSLYWYATVLTIP
jgi:hypothetical protein